MAILSGCRAEAVDVDTDRRLRITKIWRVSVPRTGRCTGVALVRAKRRAACKFDAMLDLQRRSEAGRLAGPGAHPRGTPSHDCSTLGTTQPGLRI